MTKATCHLCPAFAVWCYMPSGHEAHYCDEHVPRGCSCQSDEDGVDLVDDRGRLLPCCEYDYSAEGWEP